MCHSYYQLHKSIIIGGFYALSSNSSAEECRGLRWASSVSKKATSVNVARFWNTRLYIKKPMKGSRREDRIDLGRESLGKAFEPAGEISAQR
jgi:hypothetical protein